MISIEDIEWKHGEFESYSSLAEQVSMSLNEIGICVIDNYVPDKRFAYSIIDEVKQLYATENLFHEAEKFPGDQDRERFRSDHIYCLDRENETTRTLHCEELEKSFEKLMVACDSLNLIPKLSQKSRFQVSCFPKNSFGIRVHCDNPCRSNVDEDNITTCILEKENPDGVDVRYFEDDDKLLSVVYYCNDESYHRATHGGLHRFYVRRKNDVAEPVVVEPRFNRVVVYWSDSRVFHETLKCLQPSFSLTSWYYKA